jgi:hypothetical protein
MSTLLSFIAGFAATLIFHQLAVALLWWAGGAVRSFFHGSDPFGLPAMISLAFWGGVWVSCLAESTNGFQRAADIGSEALEQRAGAKGCEELFLDARPLIITIAHRCRRSSR